VTSKRGMVATFSLMMMLTIFGGVVSAHHSRAGYDNKKTVTLKGVVKEVAWRNPHVYVIFGVKDDKGTVVQWTGELSSVSTMLAAGMSKDTLKAGDEIVVVGAPAEAGTPQSLIAKLTRADGTLVVADSYRSDTR
jgi:hypothetical protein